MLLSRLSRLPGASRLRGRMLSIPLRQLTTSVGGLGLPVAAAATAFATAAGLDATSVAEASAAPVDVASSADAWNRMIPTALGAVVSIKVNRVRAFDTTSAGTVQATGFIVDKQRGYIMTNRHVAGPGPIVAEAIFENNEEVPVQVAYYDPVHDFAILKFDPSAVKHME